MKLHLIGSSSGRNLSPTTSAQIKSHTILLNFYKTLSIADLYSKVNYPCGDT